MLNKKFAKELLLNLLKTSDRLLNQLIKEVDDPKEDELIDQELSLQLGMLCLKSEVSRLDVQGKPRVRDGSEGWWVVMKPAERIYPLESEFAHSHQPDFRITAVAIMSMSRGEATYADLLAAGVVEHSPPSYYAIAERNEKGFVSRNEAGAPLQLEPYAHDESFVKDLGDKDLSVLSQIIHPLDCGETEGVRGMMTPLQSAIAYALYKGVGGSVVDEYELDLDYQKFGGRLLVSAKRPRLPSEL